MKEIRYWSESDRVKHQSNTEQKQTRETVEKHAQSFKSSLLSELAGKGGGGLSGNSMKDLFGSGLGNADVTGNLMDLDVDGIEKVWAEQLKSPIDSFNFSNNSSNKNNSYAAGIGGLDSFIDLTMQAQMLRAKKALGDDKDLLNMGDFTRALNGDDSEDLIESTYKNIDEFLAHINSEFEKASKTFNVSIDELKRQAASSRENNTDGNG